MARIVEVRNSAAEFLTFVAANKEEGVQVVYKVRCYPKDWIDKRLRGIAILRDCWQESRQAK